jgi:hypothetical protein
LGGCGRRSNELRVLGFLLILESFLAALYLSQLISALPGHDASVVALILARGGAGALQFTAGWLLISRRPTGVVVARWAIVCAMAWELLAVGFNLAPTGVYPWWRWQVTGAYALYAGAIWIVLSKLLQQSR